MFSRVSPQVNPDSCSVTATGNTPIAPAARAVVLLRLRRPCVALGSSQNKFVNAAKNAAQTSSGPTPRKHSWALGSMGPLR